MKPVIAIFDDFFLEPDAAFDEIVAHGDFTDITNPVDGVTYPTINTRLPVWVESGLRTKLKKIIGHTVIPKFTFARLMLNGHKSPHTVHSDLSMGKYSAHIYLSKNWPLGSGTSFYFHKTEGVRHRLESDQNQLQIDLHDENKWIQYFNAQAKYNRILIHEAALWHCAEPIRGFGDNLLNGRVVLTCFFDILENK
jgi:hypothetical protein